VLILIGITQIAGYLEIQYFDYKIKHEGIDRRYGSSLIPLLLLIIHLLGFSILVLPREWVKGHQFASTMLCLLLATIIVGTMVVHVRDTLATTVAEELKDSNIDIGYITKKDIHKGRHQKIPDYYMWAGINDTTTSCHRVEKQKYQSLNIGDTVVLQISRKYPCINRVLIWNPSPKEIARYKDFDK
ncbi:MAG: hypothetical protein K6F33_05820, partial [Bacteroidales bacterium]|nr:hypothetical protein [Bacteroidales bacterium]